MLAAVVREEFQKADRFDLIDRDMMRQRMTEKDFAATTECHGSGFPWICARPLAHKPLVQPGRTGSHCLCQDLNGRMHVYDLVMPGVRSQ